MHSWIFRHRRGLAALYRLGQDAPEPEVPDAREVLRPRPRLDRLPPAG